MTARIFLKLILGVVCVLSVALTVVNYLAARAAERTYVDMLTRELAEKALMLAHPAVRTDSSTIRTLAAAAGARVTRIGHDGRVTADSEADPVHMENHASRPEVAAALRRKTGSNTRTSSTLGVKYLYVAVPVSDGALRLAVPLRNIDQQVRAVTHELLRSVALAFIPGILLAALLARYFSRRLAAIIAYAGKLARGEFEQPLPVTRGDELGILSQQLNETGAKLENMFAALQQEHEKLEKLENVRKDFVINVSHELRTPLASIQGYTETLLDGALHDPEHNVRFLSIIRQNAERLARLIGDLMTLSQIELERTRFQIGSYYINQLIAHCVDSMTPLAEKKSIRIRFERAPDATEACCDSEAVHQIITNLVDNAIKYTPEGGEITLGAQQPGDDSAYIEIFVRDTGIGIPEQELPRLFERFYRVDKARSRELGGTGLGLAIVKHLVRAQGGEVRVESRPNCGSTFSFTLPVRDPGPLEDSAVQAELTSL
ncbi:MAG TPA: ATP-binding protein [Bryobacteraceae bacterium]|nr:ATP-binding protein [Bryobacteraceae bacterium]